MHAPSLCRRVRYSTQITPVNYNLMTVIAFMAATGLYQIYRVAMGSDGAK